MMHIYALRLRPMHDLKHELIAFTQQQSIQAGFILTCVGSLQVAALRLANRDETTIYERKFEICSLVGTLDPEGCHLHISLSDGTGAMIGGHLQDGNLIYTTAEIVIGAATNFTFRRDHDAQTGYPELVISPL